MRQPRGTLSRLAQPGATLAVHVTPGAGHDAVALRDDGTLSVRTTARPEAGRANAAVQALVARALGVAPSRLALVSGVTARDKRFRLD